MAGALLSVPLALGVAIFAGAPAYFLLRRLGWLSWWQVTVAGAALALPVAVGQLPNQYFFAVTLGSGLAAGLLFWAIGIRSDISFRVTPNGTPPTHSSGR